MHPVGEHKWNTGVDDMEDSRVLFTRVCLINSDEINLWIILKKLWQYTNSSVFVKIPLNLRQNLNSGEQSKVKPWLEDTS